MCYFSYGSFKCFRNIIKNDKRNICCALIQYLFIWKTFSMSVIRSLFLYAKGSGIAMGQTFQCTEETPLDVQNDFAETSVLSEIDLVNVDTGQV